MLIALVLSVIAIVDEMIIMYDIEDEDDFQTVERDTMGFLHQQQHYQSHFVPSFTAVENMSGVPYYATGSVSSPMRGFDLLLDPSNCGSEQEECAMMHPKLMFNRDLLSSLHNRKTEERNERNMYFLQQPQLQ